MKETAFILRTEDPKRNTQAVVAAMLGVARSTIEGWFTSNDKSVKASKPDARVAVPRAARKKIKERVAAGESQTQVAADFGVSHCSFSRPQCGQDSLRRHEGMAARGFAQVLVRSGRISALWRSLTNRWFGFN